MFLVFTNKGFGNQYCLCPYQVNEYSFTEVSYCRSNCQLVFLFYFNFRTTVAATRLQWWRNIESPVLTAMTASKILYLTFAYANLMFILSFLMLLLLRVNLSENACLYSYWMFTFPDIFYSVLHVYVTSNTNNLYVICKSTYYFRRLILFQDQILMF